MTTRAEILDLDGHRCRRYGCGNTAMLEEHHIIPRSQESCEEVWNKITLCSICHKDVTEGKITNIQLLQEIAYKQDFRWQKALDWHISRGNLR